MIAAHVDDLALFVHDFVVLENVLANFAVALLDSCLCPFNRLRHHLCFDCFIVWKRTAHYPTECTGGEQTQQFVFKTEIEATCSRVALAPRTAAQLVVDTTAVVTFGAENIQTANGANLVAFFLALCLENRKQNLVARESSLAFGLELFGHFFDWCRQSEIVDQQRWVDTFGEDLLAGKKFGVSTKEDVDASTRHVCCNSDCSESACLGNNLCFASVLLCVQYFVTNTALGQLASKIFALFNTDCAHKNRLTLCVTLGDVFDDCFKLRELGLVDEVWLIYAHNAAVGRNRDHLQ